MFSSIYIPLTILFTYFIERGEFPSRWKNAMVIPIFKSGRKTDVTNYRPISKISIIPKLLEKLTYNHFFALVKNLIITEQHGFFRGRSLETNLVIFCEYLPNQMDQRVQVDAIYANFSKAFDKISHNVLLSRWLRSVWGEVFLDGWNHTSRIAHSTY